MQYIAGVKMRFANFVMEKLNYLLQQLSFSMTKFANLILTPAKLFCFDLLVDARKLTNFMWQHKN